MSQADLDDFLLAQHIGVIGNGNRISAEALAFLDQLALDIERKIQDASTDWSRRRLNRMLTQIRGTIREAQGRMMGLLGAEGENIVRAQAQLTRNALGAITEGSLGIAAVPPGKLSAILNSQPFNGRTMTQWFDGWSRSAFEAMRSQVNIGYAEGEGPAEIARRLIGNVDNDLLRGRSPGSRRYRGVFVSARRNARTIIRTALNHYANSAREAVYEANDDVLEGVEYSAVLDSRTTVICASRDGNVYPVKGPKPELPAHPNCRSVYYPVVRQELIQGGENLPPRTTASADGPIRGNVTYQDWLRRQPDWVQNRVLGTAKADLFRSGELELSQFVDEAGMTFTIAELRDLYPSAFG